MCQSAMSPSSRAKCSSVCGRRRDTAGFQEPAAGSSVPMGDWDSECFHFVTLLDTHFKGLCVCVREMIFMLNVSKMKFSDIDSHPNRRLLQAQRGASVLAVGLIPTEAATPRDAAVAPLMAAPTSSRQQKPRLDGD